MPRAAAATLTLLPKAEELVLFLVAPSTELLATFSHWTAMAEVRLTSTLVVLGVRVEEASPVPMLRNILV